MAAPVPAGDGEPGAAEGEMEEAAVVKKAPPQPVVEAVKEASSEGGEEEEPDEADDAGEANGEANGELPEVEETEEE